MSLKLLTITVVDVNRCDISLYFTSKQALATVIYLHSYLSGIAIHTMLGLDYLAVSYEHNIFRGDKVSGEYQETGRHLRVPQCTKAQ